MTELQKLKQIKYILHEKTRLNLMEVSNHNMHKESRDLILSAVSDIINVSLIADELITTKSKKRKSGVAAAKKAPKKKGPEMFSWEWWMA